MNLPHRAVRRLLVPALAAALAIPVATPVRSAPQTLDRGSYVVSLNGKSIGREDFHFMATGDSLVVTSSSTFTRPTPEGDRQTKKLLNVVLGQDDMMLRSYTSNEEFDGHVRVRGVVLNSETALTLLNELDGRGFGNTYERPAGRVFVLESQLYALMHLIAYTVRDQSFDRRPVNIIALAQRDTITEAEIVRLPAETIRWGNKPVKADHLQFVQAPVVIDLWMDQLGRALRIEHGPSGLRVEREAQKVKPKASRPGSGG